MKKFLLCMLLAGLMMPVVAQEKVSSKKMYTSHINEGIDLGISDVGMLPMNPKGVLVGVDGWKYAGISNSYDRQSQKSVYPMTQVHTDGFIGCTWTNEDNPRFNESSTPFRGVGYAFATYKGLTWSEPDLRVGGIPLYWPSYAQWGANGEVILARSADTYEHNDMQILNGLVLLTRENKGVGEWKLTVVPYPEGTSDTDGYTMAWARMTTSGYNHQYIHIMSPMSTPTGKPYEGYDTPIFYYRTQDGGTTWDIAGELVPEMVGQEWHSKASFNDAISFAVQGDIVACSFIRFGLFENYVLKSLDNGNTWKSTCFYYSDVSYYGDPSISIDTVYIPTQGCIALDMDGKIHVAFGVEEATNNGDDGYITYMSGLVASFLSYWNEDMPPIDGNVDFIDEKLEDMLFYDYFDLDYPDDEDRLYVNSTIPKWPLIGYYTPTIDEGGHLFTIDTEILRLWMGKSYSISGLFSFPQMAFDADNTLHLAYLGVLDGGNNDSHWFRHPYYTTRTEDGTWTETEYLVNKVTFMDQEFAYLTLAGLYDDKMFLMAQIDQKAGVYTSYQGQKAPDHEPTTNYYYFFYIKDVFPAINEVDYTPLTMSIYPNPASGQVNVEFEGKGNITVYNMLGQTVYHVENVENKKDISLNNMATGVYFVTVRSGNAIATQKLIVK
jgi:hypothetical protein